jgi:hypothetical protein
VPRRLGISRPESRTGSAGKSSKTPVIERLFFTHYDESGGQEPRYDPATGTIPEHLRLVYTHEVLKAADELRVTIDNEYAFFKDLLRLRTRNANWPSRLKELRWTAVQVTGTEHAGAPLRCFKFLPYADGQTEPFPDDCPLDPEAQTIPIQSVTMSVAAKQITRLDEARLIQIAVELRIIETHFAIMSPLATDLLHIDHLQMGMKLRRAEIDALFQAELGNIQAREPRLALITVEAKQAREHVTFAQVLAQVYAASKVGVSFDMIVPLVVKHRAGGIHVVEFKPFIQGTDFSALESDDMERTAEAFYKIEPPIKSLGEMRPLDGVG